MIAHDEEACSSSDDEEAAAGGSWNGNPVTAAVESKDEEEEEAAAGVPWNGNPVTWAASASVQLAFFYGTREDFDAHMDDLIEDIREERARNGVPGGRNA